VKNWLFALGGVLMLIFSILDYMAGGPIFFVFLQVLVNIASVLMMLNTDDKIDVPVIVLSGLILIVWSLTLFDGMNTVYFVIGLSGIGLGYALEMGTIKRNLALFLGSALIATFSYLEASWIFFWLNVFFALFSAKHVWELVKKRH
jgi:hypothetical protein